MAPRTVAGRDAVGLSDDELVWLSGVLVENLRLAARDLDAFVHASRTSGCRGNGSSRSMRSASRRARCGAVPTLPLGSSRRRISAGSTSAVNCASSAEQTRERIVLAASERFPRLHRRTAQSFVQVLAVSAAANGLDHHRLGAGEGPVRRAGSRDAALVDAQPVDHPARERDDLVGAQQRFGERRAPVRAVVERAFQESSWPRSAMRRRRRPEADARANRCART